MYALHAVATEAPHLCTLFKSIQQSHLMVLMLVLAGGRPSGLQPEAVRLSPVQGATHAGGLVDTRYVVCMSSVPHSSLC